MITKPEYRKKDYMSKNKVKDLVLIAMMSAVICIAGPFSLSLPFTPVPVSLTNLAIYFVLYVMGTKRTVMSYLIYLLLGGIGLPVFSNFSGGFQKLAGPTGGYLIGFILMAAISGFFIDRWYNKPLISFFGMWIGKIFSSAFGTLWLAYSAHLTFTAALISGVVPFLLGDFIKTVAVAIIGPIVRNRLINENLVLYT